MAHIVGVPKREPCQKCSLPVFLAERLTIGKNVYHRTCLRCARCNSQLTPGSFYETEIDGEYCCETCPDEEKKLDVASTSTDNKDEPFNRKSIAERLAFFENDGNKVLQKSLSDEEKSQSLKKLNETQLQTLYKPNSALNNFMNSHLTDTVASASHNTSRRSSNASTSSNNSSSMSDDISEEPPELPKSLPPSSLEVNISGTPSLQPSEASLEISAVDSSASVDVKSQDVYSNGNENTLPDQEEPSDNKTEQKKDAPAPTHNDLNLSINVTKDSSENDDQMRTKTDPTSVDRCKETATDNGSQSTNRLSMVRARLHQFEVIANKSQDSSISSVSKNNRLSNLSKINRRSIDESPKSLETEVPKNESEHGESHHDSLKLSSSTDPLTNNEIEDASCTSDKENNSHVTKEPTPPPDNTESEEFIQTNLSVDKANSSVMLPIESEEVLSDTLLSVETNLENIVAAALEKVQSTEDSQPADVTDNMASPEHISKTDEYPEELNPFKSDDEEDEEQSSKMPISVNEKRKSLNPFDSSDDDNSDKKQKPPRPPPPKKISTNPFGSDTEEEDSSLTNTTSNSSSTPKRTPIPTPRNYRSSSRNLTPEPIPRITRQSYETPLRNTSDYYGSTSSLSAPGSGLKTNIDQFHRESDVRGSGRSLASSSGSASGTAKPRKKKAPAPPPPVSKISKELFSPTETDSKKSSPGSSTATTPTPHRKKRPAPAPPSILKTEPGENSTSPSPSDHLSKLPDTEDTVEETKDINSSPQLEKLCDEEKALLENNSLKNGTNESHNSTTTDDLEVTGTSRRRLITLDASLVEDAITSQDFQLKEEKNVVYRRTIVPTGLEDLNLSPTPMEIESHDRQLEKLKDNKEAKNRNRQSQISLQPEENDPLFNKSIHGKWKRRKGPAPALPIPPKKVLQMLPLQEIRHELEIIEVQQQGLEKQGVMLEKMIRERCEGPPSTEATAVNTPNPPNSKEVEDLILQLFELVNEKNELFRRQAELMYLRRQHRLEQEQADLEYEIRVLMAQPERNKTDSDKAREEALIGRLVEVVQLRNEVIERLEMDRLREAEEDMSIKQRLEMHSAKRDEELSQQTPTKLSKKEKKKQKEIKKLGKSKKLDADKDADESELNTDKQKMKKKKKKFLF